MTPHDDCPLCHPVGELVLWRGERLRVVAVDDADHPGYTRVVWNDHAAEMTDLSPQERQALMDAVWRVEQAQRQCLRPDKINLAQFGNMVPHLHWHIIPRWRDDSHFPQAIWAPAPERAPGQHQAWQARRPLVEQQLSDYHSRLAAALAPEPPQASPMPSSSQAQNTLDSPLLPHLQNLDEVWKETLREPEPKNALRHLSAFLKARLQEGAEIYPRRPLRALDFVQPDTVRVVILGQDPYHGPGQAQGLAFSVPDDCPAPPSLQNIFKELALEYPEPDDAGSSGRQRGAPRPPGAMGHDLSAWARQGVLLLNTVLTVEARQPASHARQGWETVTDALIQRVALSPQPKVFMLWGSHAQAKRQLLPAEGRHLVLLANHPSPLSALRPPRPFIGCNHFRLANEWLVRQGAAAIDWTGMADAGSGTGADTHG